MLHLDLQEAENWEREQMENVEADRIEDMEMLRENHVRRVYIPARVEHEGWAGMHVNLEWTCPDCGGQRGETFSTFSYDGSRRLSVDGWNNPCGHVDKYSDLRREARSNGLNPA